MKGVTMTKRWCGTILKARQFLKNNLFLKDLFYDSTNQIIAIGTMKRCNVVPPPLGIVTPPPTVATGCKAFATAM